jgi:diguanylate cyclase (GGDEF)-like protein
MIHIQPQGCLFVCDADDRIIAASDNTDSLLGRPIDRVLQHTLAQLLDHDSVHQIHSTLIGVEALTPRFIKVYSAQLNERKQNFQLTAWKDQGYHFITLEPLQNQLNRRLLARASQWLAELAQAENRETLLDTLVRGVRQLSRYERVQVCQYQQAEGLVLAESRNRAMKSLLNHHLTTHDLLPQAAKLYARNPVRSLADLHTQGVEVVTLEPFRLTPEQLAPSILCTADPAYRDYLDSMGLRASLSFAIHRHDQLWGLVICHSRKPCPVSPAQRDAIMALVHMATQRLFLLEYRSKARFVERVLDSRHLLTGRSGHLARPHDLLQDHGEQWMNLFSACAVALVSSNGIVGRGEAPDSDTLEQLSRRLRVIHHEHTPWYSHALQDTRLAEIHDLSGLAGLLALPLAATSPTGWLLLFRREQPRTEHWAGPVDGRFTTWQQQIKGQSESWRPDEIQAATDLAEDLAVAVASEQIAALNAQLRASSEYFANMARTDALTGISNRYHIEECVEKELEALARYERPLSIILFDIDHFKQINDTLGHEAGDQVLQQLSQAVKACLRLTDQFGRWGGEEFLILAVNTPLDDSLPLAERLREHIAQLAFEGLEQVTVSMGVAEGRSDESVKALVARADTAMYQAKQSGRNRVTAADLSKA